MNNSSFDYAQYVKDSEASKANPLPRRTIDVGSGEKIEVFGRPGYEKKPGLYLLSQINATSVVGKAKSSWLDFCKSKSPYVKPCKGFEWLDFWVENSNAPIKGILPDQAIGYWMKESAKNPKAGMLIFAFATTSIELYADMEFGVNRQKEEYTQRLQDLLFRVEVGDYSIHFVKEYYQELYRVLPFVNKRKHGRPPLFGHITREYFYNLFPGRANDIFDSRNADRENYNHQFLTEMGDKVFDQVMISFLTFLRCSRPGDWANFVSQYRNAYGDGFQGELEL
jgi:hypothetical protein